MLKKIMKYIIFAIIIAMILPCIIKKEAKEIEDTSSNEIVTLSEPFNYGDYTTINLLHASDNSVETMNLDEYLLGVVSAEMPASYEMEALKAQAVVARTYTIYKIKNIEKRYMQEKGESISIKKLSEILKVTEIEIVSAIEASRQVESINEEAYEEGNCTKIEKIANNYDEQGRLIDKLTLNQMIDDLKERDKKVIKLRFYQEKTQSQVAKLLGISQVQVSRIEKKILRELKEKIIQENVS